MDGLEPEPELEQELDESDGSGGNHMDMMDEMDDQSDPDDPYMEMEMVEEVLVDHSKNKENFHRPIGAEEIKGNVLGIWNKKKKEMGELNLWRTKKEKMGERKIERFG